MSSNKQAKNNIQQKHIDSVPTTNFLPTNLKEMHARGWEQADFVYICGDAYVDHSSFGASIITRLLESHGYKVAFIAQPDWKDDKSITICGEPRLAFLISGGNMDSMVNHYTSAKKRRHQDAYTPGGGMSRRPDRATIVYGNLVRKTYKNTPILIGGIEASLRRMAHYDYWSDKVKRSILLDSGADILMYGMGEHSMIEIADALDSGLDVKDITYVRGTVFKCRDLEELNDDYELLPSYGEILADKKTFAQSYYTQYINTDAFTAKRLVEKYKDKEYIVQNPPAYPLTTQEMDEVYALPYAGTYHPSYEAEGGVPAIREVRFSLASNRGCYGGCSFCAITFHQGRTVQARSHESILAEAKKMTEDPEFKGYIHDVGGPTADFRRASCDKQLKYGVCTHKQCLFPRPCKNLIADHTDYIELLRKLRALPGVKKVFIRSGIRFDYVLADQKSDFLTELCKYHVSGQLRVAPEHISDSVLSMMGKPENTVYEKFVKRYHKTNERLHLEQYLVPYLMSSHPGSGLKEAIELAEYVRDLGYMPEQVQDFYPTPGTISTCMYYTGLDPRTLKKVYVPTTAREKKMQRALIQYRNPENYEIVRNALLQAGREDLIGFGPQCLIPPRKMGDRGHSSGKMGSGRHSSGKMETGKAGHKNSEHRTDKRSTMSRADNKQSDRRKSKQFSKQNSKQLSGPNSKNNRRPGRKPL